MMYLWKTMKSIWKGAEVLALFPEWDVTSCITTKYVKSWGICWIFEQLFWCHISPLWPNYVLVRICVLVLSIPFITAIIKNGSPPPSHPPEIEPEVYLRRRIAVNHILYTLSYKNILIMIYVIIYTIYYIQLCKMKLYIIEKKNMLAHVELPWLDFLINNTVLTLNVLKRIECVQSKDKKPPLCDWRSRT